MNMLKLTAAAALVAASLSASAMSSITDDELSTVSGQDGVSIAANLNINIGSFVYSEANSPTTGGSASVSFNNIQIGGLVAMTVDVISANTFGTILSGVTGAGTGTGTTAASGFEGTQVTPALQYAAGTGVAGYYSGTDVVQFAFPNVAVASNAELLSIKVGGITMGTNGAQTVDATGKLVNPSFGSFAINGLDLRGTTVWLWAH